MNFFSKFLLNNRYLQQQKNFLKLIVEANFVNLTEMNMNFL